MPLKEAVRYIQSRKRDFRCVELKYADKAVLDHDLILNLPEHGMHLRFESGSQRLRLIEVYDNSRIQLRYGKGLLGGASHAATALLVYNLLGPTVSGTLDITTRLYPVHYSGLLFLFPIPAHHTHHFLHSWGEIPLEFPDKTTPVASRICVYPGTADSPEEVACIQPPPLSKASLFGERVTATLQEGLIFERSGRKVCFGDTPQDVCAEIGPPTWTYFKSGAVQKSRFASHTTDYFYCYADRGIDVLFDGITHKAKKFVLRTNAPGHPEFNTYSKCHFSLNLIPAEATNRAEGEKFIGMEVASSRGNDMHLREGLGQTAAGSPAIEDVTAINDGPAKATKQSPRWQDASPRGPPLGNSQDFLSNTSDTSKASSSLVLEENDLEEVEDQRDGWGDSDFDEAILDHLGVDRQPGNNRQSGSEDMIKPVTPETPTEADGQREGQVNAQAKRWTITCDSKFEDVQEALKGAKLSGVHSRGIGCADPVARTIVHGYKGAAFEVMRNGYLASVTLFSC